MGFCPYTTDEYGNSTAQTSGEYKIDVTNPTVGSVSPSGTMGSNSWYTSNVTFNVTLPVLFTDIVGFVLSILYGPNVFVTLFPALSSVVTTTLLRVQVRQS